MFFAKTRRWANRLHGSGTRSGLLLQGHVGSVLALRGLDSNDLNGSGRVAVRAQLIASQRVDADVEKIVGRVSLEPTMTAARWQPAFNLTLRVTARWSFGEWAQAEMAWRKCHIAKRLNRALWGFMPASQTDVVVVNGALK